MKVYTATLRSSHRKEKRRNDTRETVRALCLFPIDDDVGPKLQRAATAATPGNLEHTYVTAHDTPICIVVHCKVHEATFLLNSTLVSLAKYVSCGFVWVSLYFKI